MQKMFKTRNAGLPSHCEQSAFLDGPLDVSFGIVIRHGFNGFSSRLGFEVVSL